MKAFLDRLRRCETAHNHFLSEKRCFLVACAGGTGLGAIECLHNMEETLKHMGHCTLGYIDGNYPKMPARKENRVFYVKED